MEILVKITEFKAGKPYGEGNLIANPVNDVLFEIKLPEDSYHQDDEGNLVVNESGIKHINKTLKKLLYWEQDAEF